MSAQADKISDLIGTIYDAAVDPSRWNGVVDGMARLIQTNTVFLFTPYVAQPELGTWVSRNIDPAVLKDYSEYYIPRDLWGAGHRSKGEPQGIFFGDDLCSSRDLLRSEFYNDLMARNEMFHLLTLFSKGMSKEFPQFVLSLHRPLSRDSFGRQDSDLMRFLSPHLDRAFAIQGRLRALHRRQATLEDSLDAIAHALFLVDEKARIVHMNAAARLLLAQPAGFLAIRERLSLAGSGPAAKLNGLVAAATTQKLRQGGAMSVETVSGEQLSVLVAPLGPERAGQALVIVGNNNSWSAPDLALLLTQLFGLTPAQSRVCLALLQDRSPADMAEEFQVSRHTVVTQLKQVFAKTGTSRQAELVRLLASIPQMNLKGPGSGS